MKTENKILFLQTGLHQPERYNNILLIKSVSVPFCIIQLLRTVGCKRRKKPAERQRIGNSGEVRRPLRQDNLSWAAVCVILLPVVYTYSVSLSWLI